MVLRQAMTRLVALERDEAGLREALEVIARVEKTSSEPALQNMIAAARLVTAAALARQESRGGHCRSDYPLSTPKGIRTFLTLADAQAIASGAATLPRRASL